MVRRIQNVPYHPPDKRQAEGIGGVREVEGKGEKDRKASDMSGQNWTGAV